MADHHFLPEIGHQLQEYHGISRILRPTHPKYPRLQRLAQPTGTDIRSQRCWVWIAWMILDPKEAVAADRQSRVRLQGETPSRSKRLTAACRRIRRYFFCWAFKPDNVWWCFNEPKIAVYVFISMDFLCVYEWRFEPMNQLGHNWHYSHSSHTVYVYFAMLFPVPHTPPYTQSNQKLQARPRRLPHRIWKWAMAFVWIHNYPIYNTKMNRYDNTHTHTHRSPVSSSKLAKLWVSIGFPWTWSTNGGLPYLSSSSNVIKRGNGKSPN